MIANFDDEDVKRMRGKLAYLKPNKYGFIKPLKARTKEENAFFLLSEVNPRSLVAKLKIGEPLEYTPEMVMTKDGDKLQARDVRRPPVKKKGRIAKGPEGLGFQRRRSRLNVDAEDFVPSGFTS